MKPLKNLEDINKALFYQFIYFLLIDKNNQSLLSICTDNAVWIDNSLPYQPEVKYTNKQMIGDMLETSIFPIIKKIEIQNLKCNINCHEDSYSCRFLNLPVFSNDKKNDLGFTIELSSQKLKDESFLINHIKLSYCKVNNKSEGGLFSFNYDNPLSINYISEELAFFLAFRNSSKMQYNCNASLSNLISKEDKNKLTQLLEKVLVSHEQFALKIKMLNAYSVALNVTISGQIIPIGDEKIVIGAITNNLKENKTEVKMQEKVPQFLNMIQTFKRPVYWKDRNYKYQGFNSLFLQYFNDGEYTEIIGKTDFELFGIEKAEEFSHSDREIFEERTKFSDEIGTFALNGKSIYYRSCKIPIYENGIILGTLGFLSNVTQEKQYRSQIKNSGQLTDYIFENSNTPYYIKNKDREFVKANRIFCHLFNQEEKLIVGNENAQFLTLAQQAKVSKYEIKAIEQKVEFQINYLEIFNHQLNKNVYYNILITPILDDTNEVYRLVVKFDDMTREVERDKQIIKSYNQSLDILSNDNKLSYIRIDLETRDILFLRIKNQLHDTTNLKYTDKFLSDQKKYFIYDFEFDEYFNQLSFQQLDKAFNKKKKIEFEYSIKKDHKFYEYNIKADYSLNPFTNHREAILLSTDITDIKRAKETIINFSEKEYDFMAVISMYVDFVNVFYQNKKEIDFTSISSNPTLSNFIDTLFSRIKAKKPDIHFLRSIINNVLKTHKPDYLLIETKSGKFKNITITTLDDKKQTVIIVCKDLTEINKKEMEIQRALKKLANEAQLANKNNTDLLANISHDMRTPLTAIMGLSNLGIENTYDEKGKEYFRNIASSSRYLSLLLNDVIELQKIESGDFELNPTQIYTPHFQSKILSAITPKLKEKNINFKIIGENKGPYYVYNDEDRMIKVLTNIITNAIKYTNVNGNITWRYKYLKKPKFHMQHIITDDGIGMSSDFLQNMANKFTKEKNFPNDTNNGSGLGLTVVNNLLHHMGGDIMCKSDLDLGTTFTVNIPLKISSQEQYKLQNNLKTYINRCALYDKDILVCEDNDISVLIIKRLLEEYKINVDVAYNGSQAIKMMKSKNYDAILMDIIMPVMNGIEATSRIRKTNKDIPIIALSSVSNEVDINNSITCGMNAHIIKPIDKDVLFDTLATYIK